MSNQAGTTEKDLDFQGEIRDIFAEGNNIKTIIYRKVKPRDCRKGENSNVRCLTPDEVLEYEMQSLDKILREKIISKRLEIHKGISPKLSCIEFCIAILLSTGKWLSARDIAKHIEDFTLNPVQKNTVSINLNKIFASNFGKKFLSKKRQKTVYYKIRCPEVSLIDTKQALKLYQGTNSWQEIVQDIPELTIHFDLLERNKHHLLKKRQTEIRKHLQKSDSIRRLALGIIMSTNREMEVDDISLEIAEICEKIPLRATVYSEMREIMRSPFGQFIKSRSNNKQYFYRLLCPEVSLLNFEKVFQLTKRLSKIPLSDVLKDCPQLWTYIPSPASDAEQKEVPEATDESKTKQDVLTDTIPENMEIELPMSNNKKTDPEAIYDEMLKGVRQALVAGQKIKGLKIEFKISSQSLD